MIMDTYFDTFVSTDATAWNSFLSAKYTFVSQALSCLSQFHMTFSIGAADRLNCI